jgi:16S rRNA (uracil1498-N3)-methyltransferase
MMTVHPPIDPIGAATYVKRQQLKAVVCDTKLQLPSLASSLEKNGARVIFVGPEGGWSDEERVFFEQECRFPSASLGSSILKGETAGILAGYVLRQIEK